MPHKKIRPTQFFPHSWVLYLIQLHNHVTLMHFSLQSSSTHKRVSSTVVFLQQHVAYSFHKCSNSKFFTKKKQPVMIKEQNNCSHFINNNAAMQNVADWWPPHTFAAKLYPVSQNFIKSMHFQSNKIFFFSSDVLLSCIFTLWTERHGHYWKIVCFISQLLDDGVQLRTE